MDRRVWIFLTLNNKSPGEIEGVLFEDDGDGYGYINGDYLLTTYVAELNSSVITVSISKTQGSWKRPYRRLHVHILLGERALFSLKGSEWALNIGLVIESFQWSSFLLVCQSSHLKGFSKVCLVLEGFLEQHVSEENATRRQVIDKLKTLLQGTSSVGHNDEWRSIPRISRLHGVGRRSRNSLHEYVGIAKAMATKNGYELDASHEYGSSAQRDALNGYMQMINRRETTLQPDLIVDFFGLIHITQVKKYKPLMASLTLTIQSCHIQYA
ncbi:Galactose mutarotase-like domain-containing protein [Artemisia annua]|uniref:Galactose mutarotase-like domain-containing protein n=1 Tax=Artemisia annua TaxID=35608 RepID=A0A2U1LDU4_ARTAN|nr:Galactose mutarotase-like domain-containing protein [Artemisia annua]